MSRLFQEDGTSVPVTIISVAANFVADIKTHEKHGYSAIVVSKNSSKNLTKSSEQDQRRCKQDHFIAKNKKNNAPS